MSDPGGVASIMIWREEYRVGVEVMDRQHRRLIDLIAGFYAALEQKENGKVALGDLLAGLLQYTRYHFASEESLMKRIGYAQSPGHEAAHAGFVAKASDMADRFAAGHLVLSLEATAFLRDWLVNHILVTDKDLARQLVARGIR